MAPIKTTLVVLLLGLGAQVQAICPIGEALGAPDRLPTPSGRLDQSDERTTYRPAGAMDDGTIVLHAVGSHGSASEFHEVLLVRRVSKFKTDDGEKFYPVTLGGEDFVIERLEAVTIDQPCGGTVSVEENRVVLTIVAP